VSASDIANIVLRARRALIALPAGTRPLRLLADQWAKVLAGASRALNGLALLVGDSPRPTPAPD